MPPTLVFNYLFSLLLLPTSNQMSNSMPFGPIEYTGTHDSPVHGGFVEPYPANATSVSNAALRFQPPSSRKQGCPPPAPPPRRRSSQLSTGRACSSVDSAPGGGETALFSMTHEPSHSNLDRSIPLHETSVDLFHHSGMTAEESSGRPALTPLSPRRASFANQRRHSDLYGQQQPHQSPDLALLQQHAGTEQLQMDQFLQAYTSHSHLDPGPVLSEAPLQPTQPAASLREFSGLNKTSPFNEAAAPNVNQDKHLSSLAHYKAASATASSYMNSLLSPHAFSSSSSVYLDSPQPSPTGSATPPNASMYKTSTYTHFSSPGAYQHSIDSNSDNHAKPSAFSHVPSADNEHYAQQYSPGYLSRRESRSNSIQHAKSVSESSFDFSIEATVTLPLQRQQQAQAHQSAAYSNNYDLGRPSTTEIVPGPLSTKPVNHHHHHRRHSSAATSASCGNSYMASIPQGVSTAPNRANSNKSQQHQIPRVSTGSAAHRRIDSISSQMSHTSQMSRTSQASRASSEQAHNSMVSGSFYVHEMRRRSAATWCDIPPAVWGIPIGIADGAMLADRTSSRAASVSSGSGKKRLSLSRSATTASSVQRRVMDIRHSHLTPRLLASEIDEDDQNSATSASNANGSAVEDADSGISRNGSLSYGGGCGGGGTLGLHVTPTVATTDSTSTESLAIASPEASGQDGSFLKLPAGQSRSRSGSVSSGKSVEEGPRKAKLFVANPDM